MFKTNKFLAENEKGFIEIVLRTEEAPDGETFSNLISLVKKEHPELAETLYKSEDEEILKKNPLKMATQKEYERWRSAMDRKRGKAQK